MPIEIRVIRRFAIGGVENGEKIREEVDQHQQPGARDTGAIPRRSHSPNENCIAKRNACGALRQAVDEGSRAAVENRRESRGRAGTRPPKDGAR
jgi:hypothetical protein